MTARKLKAALPVLATLSLAVLVNLWTVRHPLRFDFTSEAVYSLSPASQQLIQRLEQPIKITFFYDSRSRAMLDARYLLEQYARESEFISLRSHDPTLEPAVAERYGVQFAGTVLFESGERNIRVNTPDENTLTNALIRVTTKDSGLICFTDGHLESNPFSLQSHDHMEHGAAEAHGHEHGGGGQALTLHERHGMGMARNALETLGYDIEQRLMVQGEQPLVNCTVVIVASPQVSFSDAERRKLEQYLDSGGAAMLLLEPDTQHGLDATLDKFGIRISRQRIIDPTHHYWTDPATPAVSEYARHRVTRQLPLSFFPGAAALRPSDHRDATKIRITPLVETSKDATLLDAEEESPGQQTIMLLASRLDGPTQLLVSGDGDFATNSFFAAVGNGQLLLNLVNELAAAAQLLDIAPREYVVASLEMDNRHLRTSFFVTTLAGPLIMFAIGTWVWLRRR